MRLGRTANALLWAISIPIVMMLVAPNITVVASSFGENESLSFPLGDLTVRWYKEFFASSDWISSSVSTAIVAVGATLLATLVGTLAALGLSKYGGATTRMMLAFLIMPLVVPPIIIGTGLYFVFSDLGLIGTHTGLILAHAVIGLPFVVINVLSLSRSLNPRLLEAAQSLGASPMRGYVHVVLPLLASGIGVGAMLAFTASLDDLVIALILSGIDVITLPVRMWNGIRFEISPLVAASSTLIMLLSVIVGLIVLRFKGVAND